MEEKEITPLFVLLRECHISVDSARLVSASVDGLGLPWLNNSTLALALRQWRREAVNHRLARVRMLCEDLLQSVRNKGNQSNDGEDRVHSYQLTTEDFLVEVARLSGKQGGGTDA